jgi:hypothetical protein
MAEDLDPDYELDKTPSEMRLAQGRSSRWVWIVSLVLLLAVAVGGYLFMSRRRVPEPQPAPVAETPVPPGPLGGDRLAVDVPPLNASDALVRELVRQLSAHPLVAAWLARDGLIRNFTVVVSNIAEGGTPAKQVAVLRPSAKFQVVERGDALYIDPQSYERYSELAGAFASLNAADAAKLYGTLKPRIEEANSELGAPAGSFDATLERAIVRLLQTPVVTTPIRVQLAGGIGYSYADDRLESLTASQKQLLRMGPDNVRIVQKELREMALALGIPSSRLPPVR